MRESEIFPARIAQAGEVIEMNIGGYDIGERVYDLLDLLEAKLPEGR